MIFDLDLWPLTTWTYEGFHINKPSLALIRLQLFKWGHFHIFSLSYNLTSDDLWPWYKTFDHINKWGFPCCMYDPTLVEIHQSMWKLEPNVNPFSKQTTTTTDKMLNITDSTFFNSSVDTVNTSNPFSILSSLDDNSLSDVDLSSTNPLSTSSPVKVSSCTNLTSRNPVATPVVPPTRLKKSTDGWKVVSKNDKHRGQYDNLSSKNTSTITPCINVPTFSNKDQPASKHQNGTASTISLKPPRSNMKTSGSRLDISVINCFSAKGKVAVLEAFIHEQHSDILSGTDSWLNDSIASTEIFPDHICKSSRKDRNLNGGGVFITVNKKRSFASGNWIHLVPGFFEEPDHLDWKFLQASNGKTKIETKLNKDQKYRHVTLHHSWWRF